ncbi:MULTISPECIES: hypothetical protein [unclassified Mesorhizobium]|uniref:hypothetical protein n=1 Tax=unclassified Mesorhizobium TaxID=325217 RepID=UPI00333948EB
MSNTIRLELSTDEAACLNNALRLEMQAAEKRRNLPAWIGVDEYIRRLDACIHKVAKAFEKATGA